MIKVRKELSTLLWTRVKAYKHDETINICAKIICNILKADKEDKAFSCPDDDCITLCESLKGM